MWDNYPENYQREEALGLLENLYRELTIELFTEYPLSNSLRYIDYIEDLRTVSATELNFIEKFHLELFENYGAVMVYFMFTTPMVDCFKDPLILTEYILECIDYTLELV